MTKQGLASWVNVVSHIGGLVLVLVCAPATINPFFIFGLWILWRTAYAQEVLKRHKGE
jgi:hypothetical protein